MEQASGDRRGHGRETATRKAALPGDVLRVYVNTGEVMTADASGAEKAGLTSVPRGTFFILLRGGRYGT